MLVFDTPQKYNLTRFTLNVARGTPPATPLQIILLWQLFMGKEMKEQNLRIVGM